MWSESLPSALVASRYSTCLCLQNLWFRKQLPGVYGLCDFLGWWLNQLFLQKFLLFELANSILICILLSAGQLSSVSPLSNVFCRSFIFYHPTFFFIFIWQKRNIFNFVVKNRISDGLWFPQMTSFICSDLMIRQTTLGCIYLK